MVSVRLLSQSSFSIQWGDLNSVTDILGGGQAANYQTENVASDEYTEEKEFSAVVFGHLEDYWNGVFEAEQTTYQDPKLVLFTGSVQSACGNATSQVGPFIALPIKMFIWISALQQNFLKSMGPAEILPWPMSLLMKLVITYKTNLVLHSNSIRSANRFLKRIQSI